MDEVTEGDLELVDALQVNPRASWATVAATLGTSAATASRRWAALCARGVAWTGSTMGPELFRGAFVEITCRPGTTDAVVAALGAMPDVLTVGRTVGRYDLYAITVAPTVLALRSSLWGRLAHLDVARCEAHVYTRVHGGPTWRLAVLNRTQVDQVRDQRPRRLPGAAVDAADRRLFLALADDARRTHVDLAAELGSTPHGVRRQVERLRRRGHLAFRADIARPMAGWPVAALLWLVVPDPDLEAVGREVGAWPETRFCATVVSAATMVLVVNLRAPEQLEQVVARLTARHPGVGVADRRLVLRLDKVHGRLLDEQGRSTGLVAVDPWVTEVGASLTERGRLVDPDDHGGAPSGPMSPAPQMPVPVPTGGPPGPQGDAATPPPPSNWGRWGDRDEAGTTNLIDDGARARAVAQVRSGRSTSLALPLQPVPFSGAGPLAQQSAVLPAPVHHLITYTGSPPPAVVDSLLVNNHNGRSTHLDALVHIPLTGPEGTHVYPGVPLSEAIGPTGITHGSTTPFGAGLLTRGVLLDLAPDAPLPPGHPVTAADLDAATERAGVRLEPGDAVVVRGGWVVHEHHGEALPGMTLEAVTWFHQHDVSIYLGDIGDAVPPLDRAAPMPLHRVGLARLGMPLVDSVAVEDLAVACREEGRSTFMLVVAIPRITGVTGLPVNPIAVF